jgi:hypothetical protein
VRDIMHYVYARSVYSYIMVDISPS